MTSFALLLASPLVAALLALAVRPYRMVVGWTTDGVAPAAQATSAA